MADTDRSSLTGSDKQVAWAATIAAIDEFRAAMAA